MEFRKIIKILGKVLFYVVFIAVFALVIVMTFSKINKRVLFIGNRANIWVMTDSMEDEIPAQSYIRIRKPEDTQIEIGDVITFYSDDPALKGHLNTHRVVEIIDDGESFVTKGDNNIKNDDYTVRAESVVGVYEKKLPILSVMGRIFQSKIGFFCILILMSVLIAYSFFSDSLKRSFKKAPNDSSDGEKK